MNKHIQYMDHAYVLALKGWGKTSPNPMVGAVLVKGGKVIAEGWHLQCGGPHAEAMAIAKAGAKAKGADLYVTLEPCLHQGRTPPCVQAIIDVGIKRVFIGVLDPNPRMNGKSVQLLKKAGIAVKVGFLEKELTALNESFNKYISKHMPFVTAKIAQTLDGRVAARKHDPRWITSQEARDYSHELRFGYDAIIVGIETVLKDDPALNSTPRKPIKKVILDTHLRMPNKGKIYAQTKTEDILIFTASKRSKKLKATIVQAPLKYGRIELKWVMKYLGQHEVSNVLIEGGNTVIADALKNGLVDKMMLYVAPHILDAQLKNLTTGKIGPDLLIEGYV